VGRVGRGAPGASGRGFSFSLAPTWGAPWSGVDRLWSAQDARGLAPDATFEAESRPEAERGYPRPGTRWNVSPGAAPALEHAQTSTPARTDTEIDLRSPTKERTRRQ